jgi:hypothetical protein
MAITKGRFERSGGGIQRFWARWAEGDAHRLAGPQFVSTTPACLEPSCCRPPTVDHAKARFLNKPQLFAKTISMVNRAAGAYLVVLIVRGPSPRARRCATSALAAAHAPASGHAAAALPSSVMNSRRLMCRPQSEHCTLPHSGRKYRIVHHSKFVGQCLSWVIPCPTG